MPVEVRGLTIYESIISPRSLYYCSVGEPQYPLPIFKSSGVMTSEFITTLQIYLDLAIELAEEPVALCYLSAPEDKHTVARRLVVFPIAIVSIPVQELINSFSTLQPILMAPFVDLTICVKVDSCIILLLPVPVIPPLNVPQ